MATRFLSLQSAGVYSAALLCIFLIFSSFPLRGQEANFRMELRFIQRLTWTGDQYAMRYEVIIEREELFSEDERGRYSRFHQSFTENEFIEVSLPPGNYRFQVIPYDFFNLPVPSAQWINFEVLSGDAKLAQGDHEVTLLNPGDETSKTEIIISIPGHSTAETDRRQEETQQEVLQTEAEQETIAAAVPSAVNRFDVYLGAVYMPLLPLYNNNEFFLGENMSLIGAGLRAGVVSAKQGYVSPGLELLASWRIFETTQAITIDLNFLSQIRFINRRTANSICALNVSLGAGVSMLSDIPPVSVSGQYSLHINIGLSFLALVLPKMYLEIGADYSQFFTFDHFGFFRPWIGIGVRF